MAHEDSSIQIADAMVGDYQVMYTPPRSVSQKARFGSQNSNYRTADVESEYNDSRNLSYNLPQLPNMSKVVTATPAKKRIVSKTSRFKPNSVTEKTRPSPYPVKKLPVPADEKQQVAALQQLEEELQRAYREIHAGNQTIQSLLQERKARTTSERVTSIAPAVKEVRTRIQESNAQIEWAAKKAEKLSPKKPDSRHWQNDCVLQELEVYKQRPSSRKIKECIKPSAAQSLSRSLSKSKKVTIHADSDLESEAEFTGRTDTGQLTRNLTYISEVPSQSSAYMNLRREIEAERRSGQESRPVPKETTSSNKQSDPSQSREEMTAASNMSRRRNRIYDEENMTSGFILPDITMNVQKQARPGLTAMKAPQGLETINIDVLLAKTSPSDGNETLRPSHPPLETVVGLMNDLEVERSHIADRVMKYQLAWNQFDPKSRSGIRHTLITKLQTWQEKLNDVDDRIYRLQDVAIAVERA